MVHVRVKERLCNFRDINAQERGYVIAHAIFATSTLVFATSTLNVDVAKIK